MSTKTAEKQRAARAKANANGRPDSDPLAAAIAHEAGIAEEAEKVRGDETVLSSTLFLDLLPLLRKPIPEGFIVTTPSGPGKPYDSTGVKSLQVLVDRMNAVLTPLWWGWDVSYEAEGKLAHVTVWVGRKDEPLLTRSSWGGVNQGSTIGNIYKGSETNAAKRAFAAIGPAHEVYLGASDFDPDTDEDAAKAQAETTKIKTISAEDAAKLRDRFDSLDGEQEEHLRELKLLLGSIGVSGKSINEALAKLTPTQAEVVSGWFDDQGKS